MDLNEYTSWAFQHWRPATNRVNTDILHAIIGISTEAGELLDLAKKALVRQDRPFNRDQIIDELGDLEYYRAMLISIIDSSEEEIRQKNKIKLDLRHTNGKNKEAELSAQRDLAERLYTKPEKPNTRMFK